MKHQLLYVLRHHLGWLWSSDFEMYSIFFFSWISDIYFQYGGLRKIDDWDFRIEEKVDFKSETKMVLTKQYDRHAPEKVFGIIGSGNATNIALSPSTTKSSSRRVFVPACENVLLWDLKTHSQVFFLSDLFYFLD